MSFPVRIMHREQEKVRMRYRGDIDGMRALAILPVLLFHCGFTIFSGGYVGVDVFFVISGYVITSKLVSDIEGGRNSLTDFYLRRIRRLLPAMAVTLLVSYGVALILFPPPALVDMSRSLLATIAFSANIYFWKNSGYFEIAAQTRPLLHMWSLAVEEQFYLFIPVVLPFLLRFTGRATSAILAAAALASLALSVAATSVAPTANFFLLPTRAWELLIGSLLAVAPLPALRHSPIRDVLGLMGLGLVLAPVFLYDEATPFPGLAALPPTLGAAFVILAGSSGPNLAAGLLARPLLVGIGLISYSLYLVHWPLIVFARTWLLREPTAVEAAGLIAGSFVLAWMSWRWVETPFRHAQHADGRKRVFAAAGATLAGLACLGLAGVLLQGMPQRMPDYPVRAVARGGPSPWKDGRCFLENQAASDWGGKDCIRTTGAKDNALLWGDSFAAHYIVGLMKNQQALEHNIVQYTFAGCPPVLNYRSYARPGCEGFNKQVFQVIRDFDVKVVIIAARWDQLRQRGLSGLADTVAQVRAAGPEVFVIAQSPMFAFDASTLLYRSAGVEEGLAASWFVSFDEHINERVKRNAGAARVIDPMASFCRGVRCDYMREGRVLFDDYGHFSPYGSDLAVRSYFPTLSRQAKVSDTP